MLDFDLQMRFWRSTQDAMFGFASAAIAATTTWQENASRGYTPYRQPPPFNPMTWWTAFLPQSQFNTPFGFGGRDFGSPFFQFAPSMSSWPMAEMASPAALWNTMTCAFAQPATANLAYADMFKNFWNWSQAWQPFPWTMYQYPMTAMLMSTGMPYAVAEPTARASAATFDAVDAARQQANNIFSAYRSDGGHAVAQLIHWPMAVMLALMPWLAPYLTNGLA